MRLEVVVPLGDGDLVEHLRAHARREMKNSGFPIVAGRVRVSVRVYLREDHDDVRLDRLTLDVVDALEGTVIEDATRVVGLLTTRTALEPGGDERVDVCVVLEDADQGRRGRRGRRASGAELDAA